MGSPYLVQIRTGKLKTYEITGKERVYETFQSPLIKQRTENKVWINRQGIMNDDGIDDKQLHNDKALFAYSKDHYHFWNKASHINPLHVGQMGENFVIKGIDEFSSFIGDTFKIGEAIIQVSQPRLPCWRLSYHVADIHFAKEVKESGRTGWHFRVLKDGFIKDKTHLQLIDRPYPQWSVARCNELLHTEQNDLNELYELTTCRLLSKSWITLINERLKGRTINYDRRLYGPMTKLEKL